MSPSRMGSPKAVPPSPKPDPWDSPAGDKVWVQILGPGGEETRIRVIRNITVTELRKAVKTRTGVPVKVLELAVGGKPLYEGIAMPFADMEDDEQLAVHWEQVDRLQSLLRHRQLADINGIGKFDRTDLHFAVLDGDPDLCKEIIDSKARSPGLLNVVDVFRDTPLMLASILGYTEIVECLIDRQAGVEYQNLSGRTALQMAAEHGHQLVCKALLQDEANKDPVPPVIGMMGMSTNPRMPSTSYLAKLNERQAVQYRIKLHNIAKRSQDVLGF